MRKEEAGEEEEEIEPYMKKRNCAIDVYNKTG